jgi:hypothetical protein
MRALSLSRGMVDSGSDATSGLKVKVMNTPRWHWHCRTATASTVSASGSGPVPLAVAVTRSYY